MSKKEKQARRLSGAVREEHQESGAFMIQFTQPAEPLDMFRRPVSPTIQPASLLSGKEYQSVVDKFRTMERKGFRVTKDIGCLIPHAEYCTHQKGATLKGYQRAFAFFARWRPSPDYSLRNSFGWPSTPQHSHLCHRRGCCRPDHLIAEEQWRNLKRNYCGLNGECDCGNEIKCLRRYQMQDQEEDLKFCSDVEEVRTLLQGAPAFVIHGANVYAQREAKAKQRKANKDKRKRKQSLHEHETARKQARLSASPAKSAHVELDQSSSEEEDTV